MNIWSEAKVQEKLKYVHGNPVKRGLVPSPEQWRWSSFRFCHLEDSSLAAMVCCLPSPQTRQTAPRLRHPSGLLDKHGLRGALGRALMAGGSLTSATFQK